MTWKSKRHILVLLFLIINLFTLLFGQSISSSVKKYDHRKGVTGQIVLDVFQDTTGLMWLTTENGLVRFDGYEFIPFNNFQYSRDISGTELDINLYL